MQSIQSKIVTSLFLCSMLMLAFSMQAQGSSDKTKNNKQVQEATQQTLQEDDGTVAIVLGGKEYRVAYADSPQERQLGLMYRRKMCKDCGMLFKFDSVRIANIWMKNTYIPLDLAYITEEGEIIDIKPLRPHDLTSVPSSKPILYALEMNQGWFAKQNIKVGDKVEKLP